MKRREFLRTTSSTGAAILAAGLSNCIQAGEQKRSTARDANSLMIPEDGVIPVAFALSDGATMIDFAGPWEVFQDVMLTAGGRHGPSVQALHRSRKGRADSSLRGNEDCARVHL